MGSMTTAGALPFYDQTSETTSSSAVTTGYTMETEDIAAPAGVGNIQCSYALSGAAASVAQETVTAASFIIKLTKNSVSLPIVPGSVCFIWAGQKFYDRLGAIYAEQDCNTGSGVLRGAIDYLTGIVTLDVFDGGANNIEVLSLAGRLGSQYVTDLVFRTPSAPLRPGSVTIACVTADGVRLSATADTDGTISGEQLSGIVDYETGVVAIGFGEMVADSAEYVNESWYNADLVEDGEVWKPTSVYADSFEYACVVYSYIPLDAYLIGINPVRLPTDGKVPIVKPGDVAVIHNTQAYSIAAEPVADQVYTLPRAADSVEIYDSSADPVRVPSTMYAHEECGDTITIDSTDNDFSGYTLPLIVYHKIEDMVLVSATQINGQLSLSRGVTKDYPVADTLVSTALQYGDLTSRYYGLFDQKAWTSEWSDDLIGDAATATYNEIDYPLEVTNSGCVTERWALVFDSTTHFKLMGENRGIVAEGYITEDFQPVNAATGKTFFFMDYRGFGTGYASGNVIRFNTEGAAPPAWAVRTTLQGPETEPDDDFNIQPRGDAE